MGICSGKQEKDEPFMSSRPSIHKQLYEENNTAYLPSLDEEEIDIFTLKSGGYQCQSFEILTWQIRNASKLIDAAINDDPELTAMQLYYVQPAELELIVIWIKYHYQDESMQPAIDRDQAKQIINNCTDNVIDDLRECVEDEWDISFIQNIMSNYLDFSNTLIPLMQSAYYMEMPIFVDMMMITYCLYYPFDIIILNENSYHMNGDSTIWRIQCKFYNQHRLEEFVVNTLSTINVSNFHQLDDDNLKLSEFSLWLLEQQDIFSYNYFFHKRLDLLLWHMNDVNELQAFVHTKRSKFRYIDELLVCGFSRNIGLYKSFYIDGIPQELLNIIQANIT